MNSKQNKNVGKGIPIGILIGSLIALLITTITGNQEAWSYMIPIGVACGVAIGSRFGNKE